MEMGTCHRESSRYKDLVLVLPHFRNLVRVSPDSSSGPQNLTICSIPSGGITTFGPLIIRSLGFDKYTAILLNMPFGAIQIIATMGGAALATWTKKKGPAIALLCVPPIIGCVMLLVLPPTAASRGPQLAGYYFISFYPGICKSYSMLNLTHYHLTFFSSSHLFLVGTEYSWRDQEEDHNSNALHWPICRKCKHLALSFLLYPRLTMRDSDYRPTFVHPS
jgi:hypothetical protein